jgi:hypothetical protein
MGKCVFYALRAEQKHGDIGSILPGNAAVNMHPQQRETGFSMGPIQRRCLKNKWRYDSNKNLVVSPKWVLDTKTNLPTARRS